jgi:hypothetical protein
MRAALRQHEAPTEPEAQLVENPATDQSGEAPYLPPYVGVRCALCTVQCACACAYAYACACACACACVSDLSVLLQQTRSRCSGFTSNVPSCPWFSCSASAH